MDGTEREADAGWHPSGWSLRTKISVVLLLPVVVALALAGAQIQNQLAQATRLSAVNDQLSVLRGTITLTDLLGKEMVTAASSPGSATLTAQTTAVDAKAAAVQHDADFARVPQTTERNLNTALGKLSGLRTAKNGDIATATGYRDIILAISDLVPALIAGAGSSDLDATANTVRSLVQLRANLATEEALLRSVPADQLSASRQGTESELSAAVRATAEEAVLNGQIQRAMAEPLLSRFNSAVSSAANRQDVMRGALTENRTGDLVALLPTITSESSALGGLLTEMTNSLADTVTDRTNDARADALRDTALVVGALLAALAVALMIARLLVVPMRTLHSAALNAANNQLPETIERVRAGEEIRWESVDPVPVHTREEVGQLARAFDDMHKQAVRLAGEQAELRKQVSDMFMTLSRRSQSLVELQLTVIEDLEANEQDPQRLEELFRLDHIATRLRRNGENLQVLAGGSPVRRDHGPISTIELLRAATSEVKDYRRISLGNAPNGSVRAQAAADVVHILAELLENATRFSPPEAKVVLTADRGSDGGLLVEVVDTGLGMAPEDLESANERLAAAADVRLSAEAALRADTVGPETTRRMGLFVVGRLAALHGVTVRLRQTMTRTSRSGITASVHVPGSLIIAEGVGSDHPTARIDQRLAIANPAPNGAQRVNGNAPVAVVPTLGRNRPVPPPAPPMRTPIFENVVSSWFTELSPEESASAESVPPAKNWVSPADDARRAAKNAIEQSPPTAVTPAGLPTRKPGARLAPGAAVPREPKRARPTDFRDPDAVRNNLSRHYNGMRAARARTGKEHGEET